MRALLQRDALGEWFKGVRTVALGSVAGPWDSKARSARGYQSNMQVQSHRALQRGRPASLPFLTSNFLGFLASRGKMTRLLR